MRCPALFVLLCTQLTSGCYLLPIIPYPDAADLYLLSVGESYEPNPGCELGGLDATAAQKIEIDDVSFPVSLLPEEVPYAMFLDAGTGTLTSTAAVVCDLYCTDGMGLGSSWATATLWDVACGSAGTPLPIPFEMPYDEQLCGHFVAVEVYADAGAVAGDEAWCTLRTGNALGGQETQYHVHVEIEP
jgi:hypothetical protein